MLPLRACTAETVGRRWPLARQAYSLSVLVFHFKACDTISKCYRLTRPKWNHFKQLLCDICLDFKLIFTYRRSHPCKYSSVVFRMFMELCGHPHYPVPSTSVAPRSLVPVSGCSDSPGPWKPWVGFVSLWICLSWTFHV